MTIPGILPLRISPGLPLLLPVQLCSDDQGEHPADLTGCTAAAAIGSGPLREKVRDLTATIVDAPAGLIHLTLTAAETSALPADSVLLLWDAIVTDSLGTAHPVLSGPVDLIPLCTPFPATAP